MGGFRRVLPGVMVQRKSRVWLHLLLFALTVVYDDCYGAGGYTRQAC